jgi:diamine N-acetyltransferase
MRPDCPAAAASDPDLGLFHSPEWPIRQARTGEAAGLSAFMAHTFRQAYGECAARDEVETFLAAQFAPSLQAQELADPELLTITAGGPGVYAGYAQLGLSDAAPAGVDCLPAVQLRRFYVDRSFHGEGIAAELMHQVRIAARLRGARGLWLQVWQQAAPAVRFYRKQGFAIVGLADFRVGEQRLTDWLMCAPIHCD